MPATPVEETIRTLRRRHIAIETRTPDGHLVVACPTCNTIDTCDAYAALNLLVEARDALLLFALTYANVDHAGHPIGLHHDSMEIALFTAWLKSVDVLGYKARKPTLLGAEIAGPPWTPNWPTTGGTGASS